MTADTPPTFLFHTDADTGVPAENSVTFYLALRKAKVPAELHIYEPGAHGVGLGGHRSRARDLAGSPRRLAANAHPAHHCTRLMLARVARRGPPASPLAPGERRWPIAPCEALLSRP